MLESSPATVNGVSSSEMATSEDMNPLLCPDWSVPVGIPADSRAEEVDGMRFVGDKEECIP